MSTEGGRYRYDKGNFGGFIILRHEGTGEPGAWADHGWAEIGEWCATEDEAKETVTRLESCE